jgi:predicted RNase H-like nuclease (RuvC/YqgF family)
VVNMTVMSMENAQRGMEQSKAVAAKLKNDLKKKTNDMDQLTKTCDVYRQHIRTLEDSLHTCKDSLELKQKLSVKSMRAVDKLASTNRMLNETLEALQTTAPPATAHNSRPASHQSSRPVSRGTTSHQLFKTHSFGEDGEGASSPHQHHTGPPPEEAEVGTAQNDKLRESLLRVSREHYKTLKNADVLTEKIAELTNKLKAADKKNQEFQFQLDEVRAAGNGPLLDELKAASGGGVTAAKRDKPFGKFDDQVQVSNSAIKCGRLSVVVSMSLTAILVIIIFIIIAIIIVNLLKLLFMRGANI